MRGWFGFGPALAAGLAWNVTCHIKGKPTVCSDTRRLPALVVAPLLSAGTAALIVHLYPKHPRKEH